MKRVSFLQLLRILQASKSLRLPAPIVGSSGDRTGCHLGVRMQVCRARAVGAVFFRFAAKTLADWRVRGEVIFLLDAGEK